MLTDAQKDALRDNLLSKSVRELINIIIEQQEDIEEARQIRRRFMQIRNLLLEPGERRKQGRPKKDI
jgi:hypothetical protein